MDTPFTPASFTSHHDPWHAPQNSTASTGLRCAELKMAELLALGITEAEFIDASDWDSMVKLFVEVARRGHEYEPGHGPLKKRLEKRFEKFRSLL